MASSDGWRAMFARAMMAVVHRKNSAAGLLNGYCGRKIFAGCNGSTGLARLWALLRATQVPRGAHFYCLRRHGIEVPVASVVIDMCRFGETREGVAVLRLAVLLSLVLMAFDRVCAAEELNKRLPNKVSGQAELRRATSHDGRRHERDFSQSFPGQYNSYYEYRPSRPAACESVIFPRTPACAERPAAINPYASFPCSVSGCY